jgi:hypothetical protein
VGVLLKVTIPQARLIEKRSDETDQVRLVNQVRDTVLNKKGIYFGDVTTTDATATSIWSDSLSANQGVTLDLTVTGSDATGLNIASYKRRCAFQRIGTGAVVLVGAGADVIGVDKESIPAWDAGFALDSVATDSVYAYVQGSVPRTVTWHAEITAIWSPFT